MCSALPTCARALEHHVLEQVGEAGLARLLVLGADVVPEVHGDDGREVVLGDDEAQAVGQALVAELDDGNGHAGLVLGRSGGLRAIVGRVAVRAARVLRGHPERPHPAHIR